MFWLWALPLGALGAVPNAFLRSQMRFRFLASYATVELIACQAITIFFAWRGFGAFSFVIPSPLAALVRTVVFWQVGKPPLKWRFRRRQFWLLLRGSSAVFATKLVTSLRENGDYMLLGLFASKSSVGFYFMAFKLAAMPVYALANSLSGVLFPALAQLRGEPGRQRAAVLSASRVIALAVIPLSFIQAAAAKPFLHLFFREKWLAAAPILSLLVSASLSMLCPVWRVLWSPPMEGSSRCGSGRSAGYPFSFCSLAPAALFTEP